MILIGLIGMVVPLFMTQWTAYRIDQDTLSSLEALLKKEEAAKSLDRRLRTTGNLCVVYGENGDYLGWWKAIPEWDNEQQDFFFYCDYKKMPSQFRGKGLETGELEATPQERRTGRFGS
jgi:hypothetical protein